MSYTVTPLSDIKPRRNGLDDIDPYPSPDSYSGKRGLQVFDLITPDGDRVWVCAGWADNGKLRAWTIPDFVADRPPIKEIPDAPNRFAPLCHVNETAGRREDFIGDYMAVNHSAGTQEWHLGIPVPPDLNLWIGKKIYPYAGTGECIVRDWDTFCRTLIVDPVRAGDRQHYKAIDIWEVTASWHEAHKSRRPSRKRTTQPRATTNADGLYLYRLYDKGGQLLYIGITDNCFRRWKEHSKNQDWWGRVHQFTQDWYPDRRSVELAERRAIITESPLYNKTHNNGGDS